MYPSEDLPSVGTARTSTLGGSEMRVRTTPSRRSARASCSSWPADHGERNEPTGSDKDCKSEPRESILRALEVQDAPLLNFDSRLLEGNLVAMRGCRAYLVRRKIDSTLLVPSARLLTTLPIGVRIPDGMIPLHRRSGWDPKRLVAPR